MQITNIEWAEKTQNFWTGCEKISDGCKFCYMFREKARFGGKGTTIKKVQHNNFYHPMRVKKPTVIFVNSWSDFCIDHPEAIEWRRAAWFVMKQTPQHTYIILTKRAERFEVCLPSDWGDGYDNVILGISAENQKMYDQRIFYLRRVKAKHKLVSFEPLLEAIKITKEHTPSRKTGHLSQKGNLGIDWAIIGGESGNYRGDYRYRECKIEWIKRLAMSLSEVEVPTFVKQLGTHLAKKLKLGKDRHGRDIENFPKEVQIRQFPVNGKLWLFDVNHNIEEK